jgi:glutaredoxin-like protein NrdH
LRGRGRRSRLEFHFTERREDVDAKGSVTGRADCRHRTAFYGISTCVWCKKTRRLLEELGVPFEYVYVDLASDEDREAALAELTRFGRGESFPTLVIDDSRCIVGFKPEEIREALQG